MVAPGRDGGNEWPVADNSPELEEILETLKKCAAALGDAGFAEITADGARLTLDEAVALALAPQREAASAAS